MGIRSQSHTSARPRRRRTTFAASLVLLELAAATTWAMTTRRTDEELWRAFHDQTLPADAWSHEAHLRIAYLYLRRHPLDDAHILMRVGIIRLNAAHGLVETVERGYHETLTRVWLLLVRAASAKAHDDGDSSTFVEAAGASLARNAPLKHYSRGLILSTAARARFVEPDLAPLP